MSLNGITGNTTSSKIIVNANAFFPDIEVQAFIDIYRLPSEYKEITLVQELKTAMYQVNEELIDYVLILQSVDPVETLDEYSEPLTHAYKKAVMDTARAGLIKYFETANRKAAAEVQGDRGDVLKDVWTEAAYAAMDQISKGLLDAAEKLGAMGKKRHHANGFKAVTI
ncbi:head completion/stabilization protein [Marinomonas atlantica]|uniref:head completion/stabilization protein n=1 Tax=Marinomonas atlantica TaxID=1806668 RepID=UPI000833C454|nr:head completion/stabilization protein [Marinomonas atlantica]